MTGKMSIFLDSGAFSAFTKNVEIDIQDYISFIKEHQSRIDIYANLDVIGDAEATYRNQKIMEKAGLSPMPCFHVNEDYDYLRYYVDHYDYIALGGVAQLGRRAYAWMDKCFSIICDDKGMPKVKVHGFAVTSLKLMFRYPWYSVDSASWILTSRMGYIYLPRKRQGKWTYDDGHSWRICVSNKSPFQKTAGRHFTTLPPRQQEIVLEYLAEKGYSMGKSEFKKVKPGYVLADGERWYIKHETDKQGEQSNTHDLEDGRITFGRSKDRIVERVIEPGISNDYHKRDELNVIYFLDLEKTFPKWPWPWPKMQSKRGFDI